MASLESAVGDKAAQTSFSGAVRVEVGGAVEFEEAYGWADRGHRVPNTVDTWFGTASVAKGLTALTVMSLIEDGAIRLDTTARSVLGDDLPLIADDVTVDHLMAHRSGIGDYLDEDVVASVSDYVMPVPVHTLAETEDYLTVLDGHPTAFKADERFAYCNGGFVVLALIAERVGGRPFRELVSERVCVPAGMADTAFLRSDELPGNAAIGYLEADGLRTNVLHLPVRGTGDGGVYTTVADLCALWPAVLGGRVVSSAGVAELIAPRSAGLSDGHRYGRGFWLDGESDTVWLTGHDAGASCVTSHDPSNGVTYTVASNTSEGAWDIAALLDELLAG